MIYNLKNNMQLQRIFLSLNNAQAINFIVILDSSHIHIQLANPVTSPFKSRETDPFSLLQLCCQAEVEITCQGDSSYHHLLPDYFKRRSP